MPLFLVQDGDSSVLSSRLFLFLFTACEREEAGREKRVTHRLILKDQVDFRKFSMTPCYMFQVTNRCSKDILALITQGTLAIEKASGETHH